MLPDRRGGREDLLNLRVFDVSARLASDSAAVIEASRFMLRRFATACPAPGADVDLDFRVVVAPAGSDSPLTIVNGDVRPLRGLAVDEVPLLRACVYSSFMAAVTAKVTSHLLIHAASLATAGEGFVLAGGSGLGKSTLALALVRRGFSILSDEVAAVGRADGLLHPFPRAFSVAPDSLELSGWPGVPSGAVEWLGKLCFDIEALRPGCLSPPVPLRHIVLLRADQPPTRHADAMTEAVVVVDRMDDHDLAQVRALPGVLHAQRDPFRDWQRLHLRLGGPSGSVHSLEMALSRMGVRLLAVREWQPPPVVFDEPPTIRSIDSSTAARALLGQLHAGGRSHLVAHECGGSWLCAWMAAATAIQGARCYEIRVGPLADTAALVCGLVGASPVR